MPGCRTRRPEPLKVIDVWAIAGVLAVVAVVALLAALTHSLGIPRNDDWAYRRVLAEFARTGQLKFVGWGSMTLVGQILWATPFVLVFGGGQWVPSISTAVLAGIGLVCAYLLARGQLSRGSAIASVLLVVALPGFALNTADFMTDVPAFSAEMACLLLGALAVRSTGPAQLAWLGGSMVAGLFGFSIREFDIAAPAAVVVVLAASRRLELRACALAAAGLLGACGAVYWWASSLPGGQPKALGLPTSASLEVLGGAYFTLSFMVSPLVPWAVVRWRAWRLGPSSAAAAIALAAGLLLVAHHHPLFIGNYLDQQGAGGGRVLAGTRPELFPVAAWEAFRVIALVAGAGFAGALVALGADGLIGRSLGRGAHFYDQPKATVEVEGGLLLAFTWLSAGVLVGYGLLFRAAFWDRYLWPVVFGVAVLLLGRRRASPPGYLKVLRPLRVALTSSLALLVGVVAVAVTLNADAYDAARWSAGEDLVKAGYPPGAIDAGFDWVGDHATVVARPGRAVASAPGYEMWYDQMFPGFQDCALVSGSRLLWTSLRLVRITSYDEVAFAGTEHLYIYVAHSPRCDVPGP